GKKLPGSPVEHIEKPVLVRLEKDLAPLSAHGQIGLHERLCGVEIEVVAWRRLKVPGELARACAYREDASGVETVSFASQRAIPGRVIPGSEIKQVEVGIIGHPFPWRASASGPPPFLAVPGFRCNFKRLRFKPPIRISGDGVEAPNQLSGF